MARGKYLAKSHEHMVYLGVKFSRKPRLKVQTEDREHVNSMCSALDEVIETYRVSSGFFVGGLCHPSRFVILWTCTSTPIPTFLGKSACQCQRHRVKRAGIQTCSRPLEGQEKPS